MTVSALDPLSTRPDPDPEWPLESIAAAIARADGLLEWHELHANAPAGPSWLSWSDLVRDDAAELDRWLPSIREACTAPTETAASYLLGWCASAIAAPNATLLVAERRVLTLDPDTLWLRRTPDHWVDATAVDAGSVTMTVLPDDDLAGEPAVDVVDTVDDLRRLLVRGFVGHMTPLVDSIRRRSRLGRRVRWGLAADSLAAMVLEAGSASGGSVAGRTEADAVFAVAEGSLDPRRDWVDLRHRDQDHVFARRSACCLAYKTPEDQYCVTCPSTPAAESVQRLVTYLDGRP